MKIRFLSLTLLFAMLLSCLTGCLGVPADPSGNGETEKDKGVLATALTAADRCKAEPVADPYSSVISFKDAGYNYYLLELGTFRNVPLSAAESRSFAEGTETLDLASRSVTAAALSTALTALEQTSCVGAASDGGLTDFLSSRIEEGFALYNAASKTGSQSIKDTAVSSGLHASTVKFNMTEKPSGNYRYVLVGDVKTYVAIVYDIKADTYTYEPYSVILASSYMLDYSETIEYATQGSKINFVLDESRLDSSIPTNELLPRPVYYDSGYDRKEIDASHRYVYDTIDISTLAPYLTSQYKLTFAISICMAEEASGYQEVYLNDDLYQHVGANMAIEYGGSGSPNTTEGWYSDGLTFTVSGDKCTPKMHIEYGAHGEHSDDWVRYQAKVTVTVAPNK